jgi:hypothetical protein
MHRSGGGGALVEPTLPVDASGGGGAVKNFLVGLLLGVLATYWYLVEADYARSLVSEWWERASSPPATSRVAR